MTGNNGNNGNNGNSGVIASTFTAGILGELGGGWFIEDRVDIPFITEPCPPDEPEQLREYVTYREDGRDQPYPDFAGLIGAKFELAPSTFKEHHWTGQWGAWRVLEEFAISGWYKFADTEMEKLWTCATTAEYTEFELHELARAARDERAAAMPEILSQHVEFITDFMALLSMTPGSHSSTYRVLHIASLIGSFAALHYKARSDWDKARSNWDTSGKGVARGPRPRPSHLLPALMPPVPLPGHPAFPSGHATQSRLMARCITKVMECAGRDLSSGYAAALDLSMRALARRIARNREIAGLHYPSDSTAGRRLALIVFDQLCEIDRFREAIGAAAEEWREDRP
jgi:hypothetical protein